MKIFLILISLLFVTSFADNAYVKSDRYDDQKVHLGLPSWVSLSEDEKTVETVNEKVNNNLLYKKTIRLPETHKITYLGEQYSSLSFWQDGSVEFGNGDNPYEPGPKIYSLGYVPGAPSSGYRSFYWGVKKEEKKINGVLINTDYYVVIVFDVLEEYSVQILIYTDGEVQVQVWQHKSPTLTRPAFLNPYINNGGGSRSITGNATSMSLYDSEGLRSGWIAKALNDVYNVDITEPEKGKGLVATMNGGGDDYGGIIAYDFSREHPIVRSFSSVDVEYEMESYITDLFFCWYFQEPKGFGAFESKYTESMSSGNTYLNLSPSDYKWTWIEGYKFSGYNDKNVDTVSALAFKFQRIHSLISFTHPSYSFKIKEIKYNLAQLPSVQFLPLKSTFNLTVIGSEGGRGNIEKYQGKTDANDRTKKIYAFWDSRNVLMTIVHTPGYIIDNINMTAIETPSNGVRIYTLYENEHIANISNVTNVTINDDGRMNFNLFISGTTSLSVTFKKCTERVLSPVTPAMVKTEEFLDLDASTSRVSTSATFASGFGDVAQVQSKIKDGKFAVKSRYTNAFNQITESPMSFVHKNANDNFAFVDMACRNCIAQANAYYNGDDEFDQPDAKNFAYSANEYYNGADGLVLASAGIADASFESNPDYSKMWELPAASSEDFINLANVGDQDAYISNINAGRKDVISTKSFYLVIKKDPRGRYREQIYNDKGQLVSACFFDGQNEIVTLYEYDEYGHLLKSYVKNHEDLATEYKYDAQGRLASTKNNDRGLTETFYDSFGRARLIRTAAHKAKGDNYYSAKIYDNLGRICAAGEVLDFDFAANYDKVIPEDKIRYTLKFIYGKPSKDASTNFGVNENLANSILGQMKYTRPNDMGAVISLDEKGNYSTIKLSSYDRIGRKTNQWIVYLKNGVPPVQLNYTYNQSSELTNSSFSEWNGSSWDVKSKRIRSYDNKGRLTSICENDWGLLASYTYTENGNVKTKTYYDKNDIVLIKKISRDVYGRVTKIVYTNKKGDEIYSSALDFNSAVSAKADAVSHQWNSVPNRGSIKHENKNGYDYSGRLVSVAGDLPGEYSYDELGRMQTKAENGSSIEYLYNSHTYRPSDFNVTRNSVTESAPFFKYDASGNVWYDGQNKVVYKNNESGLPVQMYKYRVMPGNITLDDVNAGTTYDNLAVSASFAYDESGTRIWYSVDDYENGKGYTEATIPGVGVYERERNKDVTGLFYLGRMDLVAGGYRDGVGGTAYFPIADAQGNVRGYVSKGGLVSAYGYYPYGTVENLAVSSSDDSRRWQSKEFDGEHGKYYFGARYYDPFFGMWMSPDPAGQFSNPYSYGGDPINFVDQIGRAHV